MEVKIIKISDNYFLINNGIDIFEAKVNKDLSSTPEYSYKNKDDWGKALKNNSAEDIESNPELISLYNKIIDDIDINFETQSEFEFKKGMTEHRI
ncbi:MAG: hypothetical protein NTY12_00910 [Candidatus Falkowbacteria bacterium]|nr:hypothetical protein [Candidatus Falkowbacteria bacterium]